MDYYLALTSSTRSVNPLKSLGWYIWSLRCPIIPVLDDASVCFLNEIIIKSFPEWTCSFWRYFADWSTKVIETEHDKIVLIRAKEFWNFQTVFGKTTYHHVSKAFLQIVSVFTNFSLFIFFSTYRKCNVFEREYWGYFLRSMITAQTSTLNGYI